MFTLLLIVALFAGESPRDTVRHTRKVEPPKLAQGIASLTSLSSQSPLLRPILLQSTPLQQSLNLPAMPKSDLGLVVKECERKPDMFGGPVADAVGRPHKWLVVEDAFGNPIHAPGLGNKRGVPGADGQSSFDLPLSKVFVRNHTNEVPRSCTTLPNVDPFCVIAKTPYNLYEGRWFPFANDCNSFTRRTLDACLMPAQRSFLTNPVPISVWDRASLLPRHDESPKYNLGVDTNILKSLNAPMVHFSTSVKPPSNQKGGNWHPPMVIP